jgi:hypothetical protein
MYIVFVFAQFVNAKLKSDLCSVARFNQFEMYMGLDATTPREWNKFPADYHLLWWDAGTYCILN